MEIELKYQINDEFVRNKILSDQRITDLASGEKEHIEMHAVYFDTKDKDLRNARITFRVRQENENYLLTIKWGGNSIKGLHVRNELNFPADAEEIKNPSIKKYVGTEIYEKLADVIGRKKLYPVMDMKYIREQITVDTGKSISVVSVDDGKITTECGETPICEMEVELYSGDQGDMVAFGEELKNKYNLVPSDTSKYKRGLKILEKK